MAKRFAAARCGPAKPAGGSRSSRVGRARFSLGRLTANWSTLPTFCPRCWRLASQALCKILADQWVGFEGFPAFRVDEARFAKPSDGATPLSRSKSDTLTTRTNLAPVSHTRAPAEPFPVCSLSLSRRFYRVITLCYAHCALSLPPSHRPLSFPPIDRMTHSFAVE